MSGGITHLWVYLATQPLLWLTVTLVVFQAARWLFARSKSFPLLNPVLVSVVVIAALLVVTRTPYERYFDGAQFVHFLLGPAVVALAIPLYRNVALVKRSALAIGVAIVVGSGVSSLGGYALARICGAPMFLAVSLLPKSVTAPVAMGISEHLGGSPALTAVLVILTGITGAVIASWVFTIARIEGWPARGVGVGTASHGIGTARMLQLDLAGGAFASLAMGLNAVVTSVMLPLVAPWLGL